MVRWGSGYTPVAADALTTLDVVATYTADGYASATRSSAGVVVAKADFTGAPTAKISGAVRLDSPVTAVTGSWPEGTTFTFSWRFTDAKNVETVSSTKTQVYTPTSNVVGRKLSVIITGTVPGHNPVSKRSASVVIAAGAFTSAPTPTIAGSAAVGSTLKATAGKWAPTATLSYQWKRNGVAISKATASSYKLTTTDYGKKITVTVTAKRSGYTTATRTSAATLTVTKPFTKATTPTIGGTARAGLTLTANPGTWSPTPTYTYQWMRNGVAVAGKTAKTYTLTSVDVGAKISVKVTYKRSGFFTRTVASAATSTVTAATTMTRDGGYKIGVHVAPGTYYTTGGNDCWFERRSNDDYGYEDGALGYSYRWEYGFGGQKVVTIKASDKYFYTDGCGTWRPVTSAPRTSVGDGTFVVGSQMKPGLWQVVGPFDADGCYVEIVRSFSGDPGIDLVGEAVRRLCRGALRRLPHRVMDEGLHHRRLRHLEAHRQLTKPREGRPLRRAALSRVSGPPGNVAACRRSRSSPPRPTGSPMLSTPGTTAATGAAANANGGRSRMPSGRHLLRPSAQSSSAKKSRPVPRRDSSPTSTVNPPAGCGSVRARGSDDWRAPGTSPGRPSRGTTTACGR